MRTRTSSSRYIVASRICCCVLGRSIHVASTAPVADQRCTALRCFRVLQGPCTSETCALISLTSLQVVKLVGQFVSQDLSAFYFEIAKDRLYADGATSHSRRSCQTVLCSVLHSVSCAVSPVLCHFAQDVHQHDPNALGEAAFRCPLQSLCVRDLQMSSDHECGHSLTFVLDALFSV